MLRAPWGLEVSNEATPYESWSFAPGVPARGARSEEESEGSSDAWRMAAVMGWENWPELVAAVLGAVAGWFARHFGQR